VSYFVGYASLLNSFTVKAVSSRIVESTPIVLAIIKLMTSKNDNGYYQRLELKERLVGVSGVYKRKIN
jgi:hypothetical protein